MTIEIIKTLKGPEMDFEVSKDHCGRFYVSYETSVRSRGGPKRFMRCVKRDGSFTFHNQNAATAFARRRFKACNKEV